MLRLISQDGNHLQDGEHVDDVENAGQRQSRAPDCHPVVLAAYAGDNKTGVDKARVQNNCQRSQCGIVIADDEKYNKSPQPTAYGGG